MPVLKKQEESGEELIKCIACPYDALKKDGSQYLCTYPTQIYKNKLGPVSLGSIKDDVKNHCANCAYKKDYKAKKVAKQDVKLISVPINDFGQAQCPSLKSEVSVLEECKACPYFSKHALRKIKENLGPNEDVAHVPCTFPNISSENLQAFLDEKEKKKIKDALKKDEIAL